MAGRNGVDDDTASSVVRESLGLTADDLGMTRAEDAFDQDDDDLGGDEGDQHLDQDLGNEPDNEPAQPQPRQVDDLSVDPAPKPLKSQALPKKAEVRPDNRGNLVDKATGQIVARAGSEARMYQKLHTTTQAYAGLQAEKADVETRLNKAVQIGQQLFERLKTAQQAQTEYTPEKYGLSNIEAIEALNFAKEAKLNPVETIKKILTRAAAGGIDLSSIGLSGGNFDPKSLIDLVRQEIGTAMNPLKERSQRETAQEQQTREAQERSDAAKSELEKFLGDNPGAKDYLPIFQRVYENPNFQNMSLGEVWAKLQLNLMQRKQNAPPTTQRPANQRHRNTAPPRGRRSAPNSGASSDMASVDTPYEDIVRGLLT